MSWLLAAYRPLSTLSSGKSSFGQALFKSMKSMHILQFSFFFFTKTVLDNQVGYLTSLITLTSSILWTSSLIDVTLSSDIFRSSCFLGLMEGSMSSLCSMMSLLTLRWSLAGHENTSLFLLRKSSSSCSCCCSRAGLMVITLSGRSLSSGTFRNCALMVLLARVVFELCFLFSGRF